MFVLVSLNKTYSNMHSVPNIYYTWKSILRPNLCFTVKFKQTQFHLVVLINKSNHQNSKCLNNVKKKSADGQFSHLIRSSARLRWPLVILLFSAATPIALSVNFLHFKFQVKLKLAWSDSEILIYRGIEGFFQRWLLGILVKTK